MIYGYDPEDPRVPTRREAEEDARLDARIEARVEAGVQYVLERLSFADRHDLTAVVCPTPWDWTHDGHDLCVARVDSLMPAVARIVYRYTTT